MKAKLFGLKVRYWDTLSAAEKRSVSWGTWFLSPILAYGLLWLPAHEATRKLNVTVPQLRAQVAQMKTQSVDAQSLRNRTQPAVLDGVMLRNVVEGAAAKEGWSAPAFSVDTAEQANSVHIAAEGIVFAQWLRWLRELQRTHHVRVVSAMVVAAPEAGRVKVSATLTNGDTQ